LERERKKKNSANAGMSVGRCRFHRAMITIILSFTQGHHNSNINIKDHGRGI